MKDHCEGPRALTSRKVRSACVLVLHGFLSFLMTTFMCWIESYASATTPNPPPPECCSLVYLVAPYIVSQHPLATRQSRISQHPLATRQSHASPLALGVWSACHSGCAQGGGEADRV